MASIAEGAGSDSLELFRIELSRRWLKERCRFYKPCGKLQDFARLINNAVNPQETYIFLCTAANGVGKSTFATNLSKYLAVGGNNTLFDSITPLAQFPRPNKGRIITTKTAAQEVYAEKEIPIWFPQGQFTSSRESHVYDVRYRFPNGSEFDLFTFDQEPKQGESVTLRWVIIDEPMPYKHWVPLKARFRFGGFIFIVMTALYDSGWIADELDVPERLGKDVFKVQIAMEDACEDHGIDGHLPHSYIVQMEREVDEEEYEARLKGGWLSLAGRVYKNFDEAFHVIDELPPYHQECWDKNEYTLYQIIDPHDRKPWAVGWYAVFPNEDIVCVAEWPTFDFYKAKYCDVQIDEYRKIFKESEGDRVADLRLMDPEFAKAPKLGNKGAKAAMEGPCRECDPFGNRIKSCPHSFFFELPPNEIHYGIVKVKELLGKPHKGVRPKLMFMRHCRNHITCHQRWSYKENAKESKGLSEMVEEKYKDFCDLDRYLALWGPKFIKRESKPVILWTPKKRASGYIGI